MQVIEEYGVKYISRMSMVEWSQITVLLKPAKTYDFIYLIPNDINTTVYALKSSSLLMRFNIPEILPGVLCVHTPTFINSIGNFDGVFNGNIILYPDIVFPRLDECLSKYLYIARSDVNMAPINDELVVTQAYHMIPKIEQAFGAFCLYKDMTAKYGTIIDIPEEATEKISENYRAMRADDGASLCNLDGSHIVTFYAGMYPLNKADKLYMRIYDCPTDNKFLVSSEVRKKKQDPINLDVFFLRV